ncbi:MAG: HIRAN domain-containing protein, partial [Pigmentiphaga sp.]
PVVGESHYQRNLAALAGGKTDESVELYGLASLVPEPANPYDRNAVRVEINGLQVGHLSREDAATYQGAARRGGFLRSVAGCSCVIVGGWDRGARGSGHFGVYLDLAWPPKLRR